MVEDKGGKLVGEIKGEDRRGGSRLSGRNKEGEIKEESWTVRHYEVDLTRVFCRVKSHTNVQAPSSTCSILMDFADFPSCPKV